MDFSALPPRLLALLDESLDLAHRAVAAQETLADALALLALDCHITHLHKSNDDAPEQAARVDAARTMTARAMGTLGRRLTVRTVANDTARKAGAS